MARICRRKDRKGWWVRFKDPLTGKWNYRLGSRTNRDEAVVMAAELEKQAAPVRLGMVTPQQHQQAQHARRPIAEVLADFRGHLEGAGCSRDHISTTVNECRVMAEECGFACLADVEPVRVEARLAGLIRAGRSPNTRNRWLASIRELLNWAMARGMVATNPLKVIARLNEGKDRRRISRALTEAEFWRLIDVTARQPRGGPLRSLYYLIAGRAGLRWREIRRLRWSHVVFGDEPALDLPADVTKNGRASVVPLSAELAGRLVALKTDATGPVLFDSEPTRPTWRRDLARAGIEYETPAGTAYRSSMRVTFATELVVAGNDLVTVAKAMRHADTSLVMRYTRISMDQTRAAVDGLGRPKAEPQQQERSA